MPRQSRSRGPAPSRAPARPTAAPARPASNPGQQQQQRSASTAAPPATTQQKPSAGQALGLFGQMASTAMGVAVGSSIGHAVGGFFGGGSGQAAETQQDPALQAGQASYQSTSQARGCETDAKAFTKCLDENKGSDYQMSVCGWYLEQLKACQSAASQY